MQRADRAGRGKGGGEHGQTPERNPPSAGRPQDRSNRRRAGQRPKDRVSYPLECPNRTALSVATTSSHRLAGRPRALPAQPTRRARPGTAAARAAGTAYAPGATGRGGRGSARDGSAARYTIHAYNYPHTPHFKTLRRFEQKRSTKYNRQTRHAIAIHHCTATLITWNHSTAPSPQPAPPDITAITSP